MCCIPHLAAGSLFVEDMFMNRTLVALVLAALTLAGCSSSKSTAFKAADPNAAPDLLVKNAVESRTNLSSLAGQGVMRIVDQPSNFGLTVNADVVADETNRLRIRADKLAGAVQAFDVVMLQDDIGFYIPTQKTLYHGKVDDLRYFSFRFDPDEVLRQMLRADTSLLVKHWKHSPRLASDPANAIMLEEIVEPGRPRRRIAIDQRSGLLVAVEQLDPRGNIVFLKRYEDYRNLEASTKREADPAFFPYTIAFDWPRDRRMMEMRFKSVEGNAVVLDEDFDIATSSDTQYLPLSEAEAGATGI